MKALPLAGLLAFGFLALARADEGAYRNLVGMAQAAATDQGPNPDDAPANPRRGTDALKDSFAPGSAARPAVAAVSTPVRPRLWTRLYWTLRPSRRRPASAAGSFEAVVSTAAVRAPLPALMPPPDSEAVGAGERRGMAELLSTSGAGQ